MNRQIKFRAWDGKKMFYGTDDQFSLVNALKLIGMPNNFEWMQYIGLLDKNGKEIYEGDIVNGASKAFGDEQIQRFTFEIYWNDEWKGWGGKNKEYRSNELWGLSRWIDLEVIGNIYENPELLN